MTQKICVQLLLVIAMTLTGCDSMQPKPTDSSVANGSDSGGGSSGLALTPADANLGAGAAQTGTGDSETSGSDIFNAENTGIRAPDFAAETEADPAAAAAPQSLLADRRFATIQETTSTEPAALLEHLREIDAAISDLVVAGRNNILEKEPFIDGGLRLGRMKLSTGQRLSNAPEASAEQRKAGVVAQLVALSHMSGLGDVASAKQLESLADSLVESGDADLAHQSRVVLMGFELQELQNGLKSEPDALIAQANALFQRPEDRNFPEFMMLQQAFFVLGQMGFDDASEQIRTLIVDEYLDAPDAQLRSEAWLFASGNSQALANYNTAISQLGSSGFEPQSLLAAARGLFEEVPSVATLEQLASAVSNIEYSGNVGVSAAMADFIDQELAGLPDGSQTEIAERFLVDHRARTALIGQSLDLSSLVEVNGQAYDASRYEGKVVLVDFWATWCVPCLKELPNIRDVYDEFHDSGFEVISVNMDDNLSDARRKIEVESFPWQTYHFQDSLGFQSKFAQSNGISMIPFIALIGTDGNVTQLHVRGDALRSAVQALVAP